MTVQVPALNQAPNWIISPVANPIAAKQNCIYTQSYQLLQEVTHYLYLSYRWLMQASKHQSIWHPAAPSNHTLQGASHPSFPHPASRVPAKGMLLMLSSGWKPHQLPIPCSRGWEKTLGKHIIPSQPPGLALPSTSRAKPKPNSSSMLISYVV